MEVSLAFVLANGRSAAIGPVPARLICDRLWGLGVAAGAATAAVRISDALRSSPTLRGDVVFGEREVPPLLEAAKAHRQLGRVSPIAARSRRSRATSATDSSLRVWN